MKTLKYIVLLALAMSVYAQNKISLENPPTRIDVEQVVNKPKLMSSPGRRQVAVLDIQLSYQEGKLNGAELVSSRRINSYAPKVFARQAGNWQVNIEAGQDSRSFFVSEPGYLEAETLKEGKPYEYVPADGTVRWSLVIPLYADGEQIKASSISIVDRETRSVIFETPL